MPPHIIDEVWQTVFYLMWCFFTLFSVYFAFATLTNSPWVICLSFIVYILRNYYVRNFAFIPPEHTCYWKSIIAVTILHASILAYCEYMWCLHDRKPSPHPATVVHFVYLYNVIPPTLRLWIAVYFDV